MAKLSLRVDLEPGGRIGPGKIALLETIAAFGSISAGARAMRMSYKRAWDLVEEMNALFGRPVVAAKSGARYRAIETAALAAARPQIEALQAELGEGATKTAAD